MIRAVIFDMDGLLTDSEAIGVEKMVEAGRRQGYELPEDLIIQTVGGTAVHSEAIYHTVFPCLDAKRLFADFRLLMHEAARNGQIPLKKGARELLALLRAKNIPCAVASSSALETVQLYLTQADVLSFFAHVQSGQGGVPSKPAPDIFLLAAAALHTAPEDCLVLEDSINGVKAGRAAGMQVGMVPDLVPYSEALAPYCDFVAENLLAVLPRVSP